MYKGIVNKEVILGANAIIGIDIDYEMIGTGMLMVSGTVVSVKE